MFEATMLKDLSTTEVLSVAEDMHRGVIEHDDFILVVASDWADRHAPESAPDGEDPPTPGGERSRQLGGEGTPQVLEFAPAELGLPLQISAYAASQLIADALDLRHRLPKLWDRVLAGEVPAWKARKIAQDTRHLSQFAARLVDEAVCETVTRQSWSRFKKILDGKIIEADPDVAQTRADREAQNRYVKTGRTKNGMKTVYCRGPAADVLRFTAQVDRLARILAAHGDESDIDTRRSKAMLLLDDSVITTALLASSEGVDLPDFDLPDPPDQGTPPGPADGPADANSASPDTQADRTPEPAEGQADTSAESGDAFPEPVEGPRAEREDDQVFSDDVHSPPSDRRPQQPASPPSGPAASSGESSAQDGAGGPQSPSSDDPTRTGRSSEADPATAGTTTGDPLGGTDPPDTSRPGEDSAYIRSERTGDPPTSSGNEASDSGQDRFAPEWRSPGVAKRLLAALAASGLDPAKIGPQYTVYAHFASEHLTYNGPVRLEGVGPQTLQQFLGHLDPLARVTLKPVLDLATQVMPVDGYEIPALMRELHHLYSPGDKFPYSSYTGRQMDIDHTISYIPIDQGGPAGQTSQANTGPLARFSHRVRTHGGMTPRQPRPGTYVWRSPNGYICITDHRGTYNLGTDAFATAVWQAAVLLNAEHNPPDTIEPPKTTLPADDPEGHHQLKVTSLLDYYTDFYGHDAPDPTDQEFDDDWPDRITAA